MIEFIIPVKPVSKKNHGRIITIGGYPKLLPSKQYVEFEKECLPYLNLVKREAGVISYPVNIECLFFVDVRRKVDLTNLLNAIDDSMAKSGLIVDDNRDIIAGHDGSRVYFDKFNPRIEIRITEIKDYEQWKNTKDIQGNLFKN